MYNSDEERLAVEAQLALLTAQYGEHFDDALRATITDALIKNWRRAEAIRKVPLSNSAEPFLSFSPVSKRGTL